MEQVSGVLRLREQSEVLHAGTKVTTQDVDVGYHALRVLWRCKMQAISIDAAESDRVRLVGLVDRTT